MCVISLSLILGDHKKQQHTIRIGEYPILDMGNTVNILENELMIENIRRLDDHIAHARYLDWLASVSKDLKQACHLSSCKSTATQLHEFSTLAFHPGGDIYIEEKF